jgi:hypothetical protein
MFGVQLYAQDDGSKPFGWFFLLLKFFAIGDKLASCFGSASLALGRLDLDW